MAFEAASSSSSSSAQSLPKKDDVFISFRGEDTRDNFTSHLYHAFCTKKIGTYIDYQLPKGDKISPSLLQAIEDSYISVVVFSENYASSRWCLDELAHILHCRRVQGQVVLPIFYNVDPSHVRNQTGVYKQAFERYETDLKVDQHKMQLWKHALNEAANLSGYDSRKFSDESQMIQKIVEDVLRKLNHKYPPANSKGLVGIDDNCAAVDLLLRDAETIGIWGMGGIGKSTIAETIFSRYSSHYEGSCFFEKVREKSEKGLAELRREFVSRLLKEDISIDNSSSFPEYRLSRMKVFVVLDDISAVDQLNCLVGKRFCQGSKILITTRDKHVLSQRVDAIYEVKRLDLHHSFELFKLNAFSTYEPIRYEELTKRAIAFAKGIPLALIVLGSYLRDRNEVGWKSALKKLEKCPHQDIQKVLRLSYDGLDDEEKKIFLDIAYFLKGGLKEFIIYLLEKCGFEGAAIGIETLRDKALINVNDGMHIEMHDLIQEMGLQVVREESIYEPERRSRLLDSEEIYDLFVNNEGSKKVQGIKLNLSQIKDLELEADIFKKMPNIRYLIFYSADNPDRSHVHLPNGLKFLPDKLRYRSHVHLPNGLKFLPDKLRYLVWHGFPLESLSCTFSPEKLVKLSMPNSRLQKLWEGKQDFMSLQEIDLCGSEQLLELPDLSKCLHLKVVNLSRCKRLRKVHPSILSLDSLVQLVLIYCEELRSLKTEFHLKSLQYIYVGGCRNLKELSVSSDELRELESSAEVTHKSIWLSRKLESLHLGGGLRFTEPLDELSCLKSLRRLTLWHCGNTDERKLHVLFGGMLSLREVDLRYCCNITELPSNTKHLSVLRSIIVMGCERLRCLPELPPSIEELHVRDCESLEIVPTWRPSSGGDRKFSFQNCVRLNEQSLHNIMEVAYSMVYYVQHEDMSHTDRCRIQAPGSKVPEWFKYRAAGSSVIVELPHISDLVDVLFCLVFCYDSEIASLISFECRCYLEGFELARLQEEAMVWTNSDHVFIWNRGVGENREMVHGIKRGNQQLLTNMKLCFEFTATNIWNKIMIKECGVHPVYVSERQKFVQQMKKKRLHDVEEQQLLLEFKKFKPNITNPLL